MRKQPTKLLKLRTAPEKAETLLKFCEQTAERPEENLEQKETCYGQEHTKHRSLIESSHQSGVSLVPLVLGPKMQAPSWVSQDGYFKFTALKQAPRVQCVDVVAPSWMLLV